MLLLYLNKILKDYTHSTYAYVLKTLQLRNRYISKLQMQYTIYTYLYTKAQAYYDNHNETKVNYLTYVQGKSSSFVILEYNGILAQWK